MALPGFANAHVIIEQIDETEYPVRSDRVIPEKDLQFHEEDFPSELSERDALFFRRPYVLDDRSGGDPPEDTVTLLLSGPGAHALLAGESGLHQVSRGRKTEQGGRAERDLVRVEVLPSPVAERTFAAAELEIDVRALSTTKGRLLAHLNHDVRIFHVPTLQSVRGWCEGTKAAALERMKLVLTARLAIRSHSAPTAAPTTIRRYRLGPTALVRDLRTGVSTGRLDQVLEGHLDAFLQPAAALDGEAFTP